MVPAPGRFSITTDWPFQRGVSRSARMRATTSVGPPAANGTMILTGRLGKSGADATDAVVTSNAAESSMRASIIPPPALRPLVHDGGTMTGEHRKCQSHERKSEAPRCRSGARRKGDEDRLQPIQDLVG